MMHARIAAIDKERLLNTHEGDNYFALADSLGIKRRTAYALVRRVESRGVVQLSQGRRHVKVNDDMRRQLEVSLGCEYSFHTCSYRP